MRQRLPGFVYLSSFVRAIKDLLSDDEVHALEQALIAHPERGNVIVGTGGVRKIRFGMSGRGKSGGIRVIYYYRSSIGRIYLLTAYAKNVQDSLSTAEKNVMKQFTAALDRAA